MPRFSKIAGRRNLPGSESGPVGESVDKNLSRTPGAGMTPNRRLRPAWAVLVVMATFADVWAREPPTPAADKSYPINLPTALQLAGVNPLDIAVASERLKVASAQLDRSRVLWLPNLTVGLDYFRHDGRIQDIVGNVFPTSMDIGEMGAILSRLRVPMSRSSRNERPIMFTRKKTNKTV